MKFGATFITFQSTNIPAMLRSLGCLFLLLLAREILAAEPVHIDCVQKAGTIRALHGVNNGPLNEGETVDLSEPWKAAKIPSCRLHDAEWPAADLVDIHAIFPDLNADPESPASYRFARTDDYVQAIVNSGSKIVYRLGESIEHTKRKHHVHPPKDYAKWTAACLGIIRHYNEGWADGHKHNIEYWEIWNEPENRPQMWTGTDEEYYRLYVTAAKTIKAKYPRLKVGGPAAGATGSVKEGQFQPIPFLAGLLKAIKAEQAPLDFFSWHTYTNDPREYAIKARAIRRWLDAEGFAKTEIHLNEWNYLPGNDWGPMLDKRDPAARGRWYAAQGGLPGATFAASVLIDLHDSPIDVGNYYSGDSSPFGLFERHGSPKKTYYSFLAFSRMLDTPNRVAISGVDGKHHVALAGLNDAGNEFRLLVSHHVAGREPWNISIANLPWSGATHMRIFLLSDMRDLEVVGEGEVVVRDGGFAHTLPANGVVLLTLKPVKNP